MENDGLETRLAILETRMGALEARQAILEGHTIVGMVAKPRRKKNLTDYEKKVVRARLVAGQERARTRREAEAKKESTREG